MGCSAALPYTRRPQPGFFLSPAAVAVAARTVATAAHGTARRATVVPRRAPRTPVRGFTHPLFPPRSSKLLPSIPSPLSLVLSRALERSSRFGFFRRGDVLHELVGGEGVAGYSANEASIACHSGCCVVGEMGREWIVVMGEAFVLVTG